MRYRDLKKERDDAVARALEAERLSMKSEFDRVTAEFTRKLDELIVQAAKDARASYVRGFYDGRDTMALDIANCLDNRTSLHPRALENRHEEARTEG